MGQNKPDPDANLCRVLITTPEAAMTYKHFIGVLAVDLKKIHGDLPQPPFGMSEVREAPPVQSMPQGIYGCP